MKLAILAVPVLLSACATHIDAPSLLPRTVEATRPDDVAAPPAPIAVDAGQIATAARMVAQAQAADAAFERELPAALRSGPQGSEAWIVAQSARSAVEVARGPVGDALRALDGSVAQAIDEGRDATPLIDARKQVQAIADRQQQRLDAISR